MPCTSLLFSSLRIARSIVFNLVEILTLVDFLIARSKEASARRERGGWLERRLELRDGFSDGCVSILERMHQRAEMR